MGYLSLRSYGVTGNQSSAALVSSRGSIDWLCLPYLDSASHFGALLDENQGGHFSISPVEDFDSEQSYLEGSNVLETRFETPAGRGRLVDWLALGGGQPGREESEAMLYRQVEVTQGEVEWELM